jgi:tRNA1Val (adenine37-N6)-methyltransferase
MATHVLTTPPSLDILCGGRLQIVQHADGYRSGVDALLLAACAAPMASGRIVDICAGTGVVGIAVAAINPDVTAITAIEVQPDMAECARTNLQSAQLASWQLLVGDVRGLTPDRDHRRASVVTINPPFYRPHAGRISPYPVRAAARHQLNGSLEELLAASLNWVTLDGWVIVAYPTNALHEVDRAFACAQWARRRTLRVHSTSAVDSHLAIAGYSHQSGSNDLSENTQCIYVAAGNAARHYTPPMQALVDGQWGQPLPRFSG